MSTSDLVHFQSTSTLAAHININTNTGTVTLTNSHNYILYQLQQYQAVTQPMLYVNQPMTITAPLK